MKENLSLLKDSLEPWRIKFINTWLQYQKNEYIDKLDDIVHKNYNTYKTIKMKPVDVKPSIYIDLPQCRGQVRRFLQYFFDWTKYWTMWNNSREWMWY